MKKWEFYKSDENLALEIAKKFNISNVLATVLINRGIVKDNDIKVFLEPTRNDFHDPYLMPDMNIAVDRILKAITNIFDIKKKSIHMLNHLLN